LRFRMSFADKQYLYNTDVLVNINDFPNFLNGTIKQLLADLPAELGRKYDDAILPLTTATRKRVFTRVKSEEEGAEEGFLEVEVTGDYGFKAAVLERKVIIVCGELVKGRAAESMEKKKLLFTRG